ncbi:Long-chain-fatty-acid--CoA ligase ACSBG2, partial [Hondaea fermentalgiana]
MGNPASKPAAAGPTWDLEYSPDYSDDAPRWYMYKDDVAKIRFAEKGIAAPASQGGAPEDTLMDAFKLAATNWPKKPALRVERPLPPFEGANTADSLPLAKWKTWTWKEYYEDSRAAAKGFLKLGAVRYDAVMILGFNSPEWFMSEMAAMMFGGKAAGIYPTDTKNQVAYKTKLADGVVAVVDTESNFEKFATQIDDLPYLKAIVTWGCERSEITRSDGSTVQVLTWDSLIELGNTEGSDEELEELIEATEPGNVACLVFTSGTTGMPKAVMVSHDNILFESYCVVDRGVSPVGTTDEPERIISFLPLSHVAGMMVDIISPIVVTAYKTPYVTSYFARPYDLKAGTLGKRLQAVRPTLFMGVPRVYEKIAEKVKAVGAANTGMKKTISTWAKGHGKYAQDSMLLGGNGKAHLMNGMAKKVLGKVHEALGLNKAKFIFSGGAPLSVETTDYFAQLGLNINETYGMSENMGATTWSTDRCHLRGSIGYEMEGVQVKIFRIADDGSKTECPPAEDFDFPSEESQGELCFRGRHVMMGYLANPKLGEEHVEEIRKKNAETIDADGFLHSGDKGSKDMRNMFRVTGRYKELIVTAGGENIPPAPIENALKLKCPLISNAIMIGDKRKFNIMLLTLKAKGATGEHPGTDELDAEAADFEAGVTTISQACESEKFIAAITDAIKAVNKDDSVMVSNACKVQKFTILPQDFSIETGEITPSLKLKRDFTYRKFEAIVEAIYASSDTYVPFSVAPSINTDL